MALNSWSEYTKGLDKIGIGVRLKHDSANNANRTVKVYYEVFYYRLAGYNWNENPYSVAKFTLNGSKVYEDTYLLVNVNRDVRHTVKSGSITVSYGDSETSKSIAYKFEHDGSATGLYGSGSLSGNYSLPTISKTATPTPPPTTTPSPSYPSSRMSTSITSVNLGGTYTVNIASGSGSYYHRLAMYVGSQLIYVGTRTGSGDITFTVPEEYASKLGTKSSMSGYFFLYSYTSSSMTTRTSIDTKTISLYPRLTPPTITGASWTDLSGVSSGVFSNGSQAINGISNIRVSITGAKAYEGASVSQYEASFVNSSGVTRMTAVSSSSNVALGIPSYLGSGNEVLNLVVRVKDSKGTWSNPVTVNSSIRVHSYASPSVTGSVSRDLVDATKAKVEYKWTGRSIKQGGTTEVNEITVVVQSKEVNGSWVDKNTHEAKSVFSGSRAVDITGYATTKPYEFRIKVSDKVTTVYVNLNSLGTEAVPLDIGKTGIASGKFYDDGGADIQAGKGGVSSEGDISVNGKTIVDSNGVMQASPQKISFGGLNDHDKAVIALCEAGTNNTSHFAVGKLIASRVNGLYLPWHTDVTMQSRYANEGVWGSILSQGYLNQVKLVTFKYNGILYGGIDVGSPSAAQVRQLEFQGVTYGITPFLVKYKTGSAGNVVNSEINNSISGELVSFTNGNLAYNGNTVYHDGNKSLLSGLNAATLQNQTASQIIASAVSQSTGGSATTGVISGRGRWFKTGSLLICTNSFALSTYYSAMTLTGKWTYPHSFSEAPLVLAQERLGGLSDPHNVMNGTLHTLDGSTGYASTELAFIRDGGSNFVSGNMKYIYTIAIGRP